MSCNCFGPVFEKLSQKGKPKQDGVPPDTSAEINTTAVASQPTDTMSEDLPATPLPPGSTGGAQDDAVLSTSSASTYPAEGKPGQTYAVHPNPVPFDVEPTATPAPPERPHSPAKPIKKSKFASLLASQKQASGESSDKKITKKDPDTRTSVVAGSQLAEGKETTKKEPDTATSDPVASGVVKGKKKADWGHKWSLFPSSEKQDQGSKAGSSSGGKGDLGRV